MRGTIKLINNKTGFIAVETEYEQYSIMELLGDYTLRKQIPTTL